MKFISTKNTLGKIKTGLSTLALGLLITGSVQAEITSFDAIANQCDAEIRWTSDGADNIASFEVQQSFDGINFNTLSVIRRGFSNLYDFSVRQPQTRAQYRIIENHTNAFPSASQVKAVKSNCMGAIIDTPAIGFYPNPLLASIGGDLHITLENEAAKTLNIQITDITGRVIISQNSELHRGLNQINLNVNELTVGTYLIVTSADGASPNASRFIVQK